MKVDSPLKRTTHRLAPTDALGLALHVRQASPHLGAKGTVVLVHGATLGSGLWDVQLPGHSVLDALAEAGYSAWAPDIRGYARSARLMQPSTAYAGLVEAKRDIAAVVNFARQADGASQVLLVGGSWGSVTTAAYASEQPGAVLGLALMAPLYAAVNEPWLADLTAPTDRGRLNPALGPSRRVDRADLLRRWDPEIADADKTLRRDPRVLDALLVDALEAEPEAATAFTVPNGTLHDLFEVFSGRPLYDPRRLTMPVLLVRGEHDATATEGDASHLFHLLGTRDKQMLTIGDAGHFICAELRAPEFRRALLSFADRLFHDAAATSATASHD